MKLNPPFSAFLLFASLATLHAADAPKARPNVLMIVIDDLNDYPLEPRFNGVKTPNLDAFARTALSFSHAYCAAPICNPSRAAVISGIAPFRSGIYDNGHAWELSEPVNRCLPLPMAFKQNGFTTLWSGKFWHGPTRPKKEQLDLWWDDYVGTFDLGPYPIHPGLSKAISRLPVINYEDYDAIPDDPPDSDWWDTRTVDQTIARLRRSHDKPFFMVCGLVRPHVPFTAPRRFFEMYDRDGIETPPWTADDWDDIPAGVKRIVPDLIDFEKLRASGKWKDVVRAYLACVSFADYNFGRVIDALGESRHAENTLAVVWSDHGYHVGEKSRLEKHALWEQTTRCLFMIRTPDAKAAGKTGSQTVSLLDIYPTLVDLCGLENIPDGQLDGRSLRPLLEDPESTWAHPAVTTYLQGNHAVRNDRYRYINYPKIGEELYDLKVDPDEFTNLAKRPEHAALKQELQAYLPNENAAPAGKRPGPSKE